MKWLKRIYNHTYGPEYDVEIKVKNVEQVAIVLHAVERVLGVSTEEE